MRYQEGELNPSWKGGTSRSTIRRRVKAILIEQGVDRFTCGRCGVVEKVALNVHHKDENRSNNVITNLIVLCPSCHRQEHPFAPSEAQRKFLSNETSWCGKCQKFYEKTEFHTDNRRWNRLQSICKKCQKEADFKRNHPSHMVGA